VAAEALPENALPYFESIHGATSKRSAQRARSGAEPPKRNSEKERGEREERGERVRRVAEE